MRALDREHGHSGVLLAGAAALLAEHAHVIPLVRMPRFYLRRPLPAARGRS